MAGTTVIGCESSSDMMDAYLTQYHNRGQCYICKAYHVEGGKYGGWQFTSKKCLHSLLAMGKVCWDMKESLLQRSKDHHQIAGLPEPKRQRGPDGRPLVKETPEQQYPIKMLDRVFKQLKDQRSVPLVFQLTRYLAKRGLDPISEGEAQALERYIWDDQSQRALEWVRAQMIERQKEPTGRRMMTCRMGEQVPPCPMQVAHGDQLPRPVESRSLTYTDPEQ